MSKTFGIFLLLCLVCWFTDSHNASFHSAYNLQNLVRWIGMFGILSIGAAFVIITSGIDLSIGSVVCLTGTLLPMLVKADENASFFLFRNEVPGALAVVLVIALAALLGLVHGLLVTKARLQPFVVTLVGLLFYRGVARTLTVDQVQGFGKDYGTLRELASGKPLSMAFLGLLIGLAFTVLYGIRAIRRSRGAVSLFVASLFLLFASGLLWVTGTEARTPFEGTLGAGRLVDSGFVRALAGLPVVSSLLASEYASSLREILAPSPFLIMVGIGLLASVTLHRTVFGRYLFAVGRNEQAARYSGIRTHRVVILAYVLCATLAGIGGVLFALDINSVQPAMHGNFYELYAIAAAVLGGCSLRGGEGAVLGVVVGTALMRVLQNTTVMLEIPNQLEFAIIGVVILAAVSVDEVLRRLVELRGARARAHGRVGGAAPSLLPFLLPFLFLLGSACSSDDGSNTGLYLHLDEKRPYVPVHLEALRLKEGVELSVTEETDSPAAVGYKSVTKTKGKEALRMQEAVPEESFQPIESSSAAIERALLGITGRQIRSAKEWEAVCATFGSAGYEVDRSRAERDAEVAEVGDAATEFDAVAQELENGRFEVFLTALILPPGMGARAELGRFHYLVERDGRVTEGESQVFLRGPVLNWQTVSISLGESVEEEQEKAAGSGSRGKRLLRWWNSVRALELRELPLH